MHDIPCAWAAALLAVWFGGCTGPEGRRLEGEWAAGWAAAELDMHDVQQFEELRAQTELPSLRGGAARCWPRSAAVAFEEPFAAFAGRQPEGGWAAGLAVAGHDVRSLQQLEELRAQTECGAAEHWLCSAAVSLEEPISNGRRRRSWFGASQRAWVVLRHPSAAGPVLVVGAVVPRAAKVGPGGGGFGQGDVLRPGVSGYCRGGRSHVGPVGWFRPVWSSSVAGPAFGGRGHDCEFVRVRRRVGGAAQGIEGDRRGCSQTSGARASAHQGPSCCGYVGTRQGAEGVSAWSPRAELCTLEQDGVAKSLAVEQLAAQHAAEVQELLAAQAPRTPPAVSVQRGAISLALWAAGIAACLPQEWAAGFQAWMQHQPSLEQHVLRASEGNEAVEESADGGDDHGIGGDTSSSAGVDLYGSVGIAQQFVAASACGLAAPLTVTAPAPSPQSFKVCQAASAAFGTVRGRPGGRPQPFPAANQDEILRAAAVGALRQEEFDRAAVVGALQRASDHIMTNQEASESAATAGTLRQEDYSGAAAVEASQRAAGQALAASAGPAQVEAEPPASA